MFDLDGTILYTLDSIARAGNRMLRELGFPAQPLEDYRDYCGDGADQLVARALVKAKGYIPENVEAGQVLYRMFLAEDPLFKVVPYSGMKDALDALKASGIKIFVFSNKPDDSAKKAVIGAYGPLYFDEIRGQRNGFPAKPSPEGALEMLNKYQIKAEECFYIGDMGIDIKTGKNAGMPAVGVLWGYRDREELETYGADYIIGKPEELLPLVVPGISV